MIFSVAVIVIIMVVDIRGTFCFVRAHQTAAAAAAAATSSSIGHCSTNCIHNHHRRRLQQFHVLSHIRRGGGEDRPHRKTDAEIDAYIESLIASVDASDDEPEKKEEEEEDDDDNDSQNYRHSVATATAHKSTPEQGDEDDDTETEVNGSPGVTDIIEENDTDDEESINDKEKEVKDEENNTVPEVDDGVNDEEDEIIESHSKNTEIPYTEEAQESPENDTSSTTPVSDRENQPDTMIVTPPNAFFRFLLRRGRVGHVAVTILLMLVEWISLYLPFLGKLLAALASYIFPSSLRSTRRRVPLTSGIQQQRTGASAKQTKARTRQSDREAFKQLQKVGDVESAKYRYVSLDFQKRHGLGPFRKAQPELTEEKLSEESTVEAVQRKPSTLVEEGEDAEDEDVNWVVEALTKEKPKQRKKSSVHPTISVEIGSSGPSVSFGVTTGGNRRSSVVQAVTSSSRRKTKNKTPGPRLSDRDGGHGIFGRLRAVAGADSVLSRSILGAYPGDAVPPSEAASPEGLTELARKYGWGDWSDEEEDDEDQDNEGDTNDTEIHSQKKKTKRKTRRRKKRHPIDINDTRRRRRTSTDFPSIDLAISTRKGPHTELQIPKPPLFSSSVLTKSTPRPVSSHKIRMVRPALDLLKERQRVRKKEDQNEE
jgi:hypothetical protein